MGEIISIAEAKVLFKDQSTMKAALHRIQFVTGDRVTDGRVKNPNKTDAARGFRRLGEAERTAVYSVIDDLLDEVRRKAIEDHESSTKKKVK